MTETEIRKAIAATTKGANVYVEWERPVKLRKAYKGIPMVKRTKMLLRLGVDYDEMQTVQQGRANGDLPAENAGLKGKEWVEFPTLKRSLKTGKLLLSVKLAQVFGKTALHSETKYIVREAGVETVKDRKRGKDEWGHMMLASETNSREVPATFDLTVDDILSVKGLTAEKLAEIEAETA